MLIIKRIWRESITWTEINCFFHLYLFFFLISALLFVLRGVFKTHYWMIYEQNPDIFWRKDYHKCIKGIKQIRTLDKENIAVCLLQIHCEYLEKENFQIGLTKEILSSLGYYHIIFSDQETSNSICCKYGKSRDSHDQKTGWENSYRLLVFKCFNRISRGCLQKKVFNIWSLHFSMTCNQLDGFFLRDNGATKRR